LKPGAEDWWLARKPLSGTVAANVAAHGTGAINVDGCRVGAERREYRGSGKSPVLEQRNGCAFAGDGALRQYSATGRWPANVVLSHTPECREVGTRKVKASAPASGPTLTGQSESVARGRFAGVEGTPNYADADGLETVTAWDCSSDCPVWLLDEQSGKLTSGGTPPRRFSDKTRNTYGSFTGEENPNGIGGSQGGASRFFYCAKSSRAEREMGLDGRDRKAKLWSSGTQNPGSFQAEGTDRTSTNHHPTVKPLALMRWLCRLITPPNGLILDPFMGSGSTGCAAVLENFRFVGIEQDAEYLEIALRRIAKCQEQPDLWSVA
jgi:site-specific DNA-methyltransferase (adenine-specific)